MTDQSATDRDGDTSDPETIRIPTMDELDAIRAELNIGQTDLSRRAGMEPSRFNKILDEGYDPQVSTMRAFLDVLREADPQTDDEIQRRGPKPTPSPMADDVDEEPQQLATKVHRASPDSVGRDAGGDR